jgi:hypothetical protein
VNIDMPPKHFEELLSKHLLEKNIVFSKKGVELLYGRCYLFYGKAAVLTHESLDEEREGDDIEDDEVEDVLPVLLQVGEHGLPPRLQGGLAGRRPGLLLLLLLQAREIS